MKIQIGRRHFLRNVGLAGMGLGLSPYIFSCSGKPKENAMQVSTNPLFFKISLAEWSLHKTLFSGAMTNLDFPAKAKNDFGIDAIEYVNQFFKDKAQDQSYLSELKMRCDDEGVKSILIMCDGEGYLGDLDEVKRKEAVDNHKKWVEAANFLGCHSIRVNAYGQGSREEVAAAATSGLRSLAEFAKDFDINVIVENHGGFSSDGKWLSAVISNTEMSNCGTLPDFGNFCLKRDESWKCLEEYDRYQGTKELMPFAKGVSAKSYDFDEEGNCIETDYYKMLQIVKDAGYIGYIGIEYEGGNLSEDEGIWATKALLERAGKSLG
ncbi:MAG TPA: sugar phosphate isomerase/epimerase family protein [Cyclobacteriaceae bacterium]|nr:sugar phosphate isomerase/epimerase family protein [Cyclobacteriaceae bacterium]